MQPQLHCNSGGFGLCEDILLRRPEEAAESLNSGRWWPGRWGSGWGSGGGGEGGEVTRSREAFSKKNVEDGWGCDSVWAAGAAAGAAAALDLTGVGGPLHFPQLDTAVEPDDGAEGERWQHAPIQAAVGKPARRVLLEQPG